MANELGKHVLAEFYECDRIKLNDERFLRRHAVAAAEAMGATVVGLHSHRYEPHGVSVMVILAESHLSLHTWPEYDVASVDVFVCGCRNDPHQAKTYLADALDCGRTAELQVTRGRLPRITPAASVRHPLMVSDLACG